MAAVMTELQGEMNMRCQEATTVMHMGEMTTAMAELSGRVNRNEAAIKRDNVMEASKAVQATLSRVSVHVETHNHEQHVRYRRAGTSQTHGCPIPSRVHHACAGY